ncbi:MAG: hypothetical protein WDM81_15745 [Rhizomicrobium sp.]
MPPGFKIAIYASGFANPRWMAVAPNGDIFLAEPSAGRIDLLHEAGGKVVVSTFASGFDKPHGLAMGKGALYVSDVKAVWRLAYANGATKAGKPERVTTAPDLSPNGYHWTRDLAIDSKGTIYVGIGSSTMSGRTPRRAPACRPSAPDGSLRPFATGTRNPVGLAFYPGTDDLFVTVNERDGYGDRWCRII